MNTYWHKHPRGFANECIILRAETTAQADALKEQGFNRLTREQARRHMAWMNAENASWGSNRAVSDYRFRDLIDETCQEHRAIYHLYA